MKKRAEEVTNASRLAISVVVLVMGLLFLLLVVIIAMHNENHELEQRRLDRIAAHASDRVYAVVTSRLDALRDLVHVIEEDNGNLDRFLVVADFLAEARDVVAIHAAPGGVVGDGVPYGRMVRLVGDSLLDQEDASGARDAISQNRAILAGPFPDSDGRLLLHACHPVVIGGESWGVVELVASFPDMMNGTFLDRSDTDGYAVQLMTTKRGSGRSQVVWSGSDAVSRDTVRHRLRIQNASWDVVVHRIRDRRDEIYSVLYAIGLVLGCCLVAALYSFYLNLRQVKTLMENLAMTDGLTGLPNRRATLKALDTAVVAANKSGCPLVLLYMDLNGFKMVNDTHGHEKGDRVLIKTAEILRDNVRGLGHVGRVGGDEFVFILEDMTDGARLCRITELLEKRLEMVVAGGGDDTTVAVHVSASFGAALFPRDGADGASLLQAADQRMYDAKKRKKGSARMGPYKPAFR